VCKAVQNLKTLKCLVLDKNVKTGHFASADEMLGESIARLCKSLPSLETLSINGADDGAYNIKNGLNPFLESLATNNTLTRLSMNRNRFGNGELQVLAKAMEKNQTLRVSAVARLLFLFFPLSCICALALWSIQGYQSLLLGFCSKDWS